MVTQWFPAIFLGYIGETVIRAFDLTSRRLIRVVHCVFHEHCFPGLIKNLSILNTVDLRLLTQPPNEHFHP